ncbi:MAG: phenylalanine--tRNA ligase subunit beta, partial [Burkholderiaceae bacterium]
MQFSEHWLRTLVDPTLNSDELAHLLTMAGLEVEEVEPVVPPFTHVVVAQVMQVEPHPNADRLRVCQVDAGTGTLLNIVCGAPNVRAGLKVPCAMIGAKLPPTEDDKPFEIKLGKLRGVESQGMLCSARELKLSEDHGGLLELPDDAPVGRNFRDYYQLNDLKFTIKLTPNRADCLSVLGVAREVAALTGTTLSQPAFKQVAVNHDETLPVKITAPDLCGRFSGRVIRGLNAKAETPHWMRQRLERSGQRAISALVDISNYVMLELGRPTHVFDLDKIHGSLDVRWARAGEQLKLLNGNTVTLDDWVGVIADDTGPEAMAGIMGGDATAVTLDTTNIYLEAAFWWPGAIQGRARRFNFSTDAAHRFERGVDFATTVEHIERITALIVEICGVPGQTQVGQVDDQITALPKREPVGLRVSRAAKIIGIPLASQQVADIFTRLGLPFTQTDDHFLVTAPSYRFDIEIEEDLIEEIARVHGFDNIPALPPVSANQIRLAPEHVRSLFTVRRQLADLDFQEVVNYSFIDETAEHSFGVADPIKLLNPIASQMSVMRSQLLSGLVANVRYNLNRKAGRVRVFEIGAVFSKDTGVADGPLSVAGIAQPKRLAALAYGPVADEQWGQAARAVDFFDLKADLEALFAPQTVRFEASPHRALHPGRSATVLLNGEHVGVMGELHPALVQSLELPQAPVMFEVDAAALQQRQLPVYQALSKFPPVMRDLALLVDQTVLVQSLLDTMHQTVASNAVCRIMQHIVLFDEYRGKGLPEGQKSLAFRVTMQDTQSTLQDESVDAAMA